MTKPMWSGSKATYYANKGICERRLHNTTESERGCGRLKMPWSSEEQIKYVHQLYLLSATWTMFCYLDLGLLQIAISSSKVTMHITPMGKNMDFIYFLPCIST